MAASSERGPSFETPPSAAPQDEVHSAPAPMPHPLPPLAPALYTSAHNKRASMRRSIGEGADGQHHHAAQPLAPRRNRCGGRSAERARERANSAGRGRGAEADARSEERRV